MQSEMLQNVHHIVQASYMLSTYHGFLKMPRSWLSMAQAALVHYCNNYIDGLEQDCSNSSVLAMELLQSFTKPSIHALPGPSSASSESPAQFNEQNINIVNTKLGCNYCIVDLCSGSEPPDLHSPFLTVHYRWAAACRGRYSPADRMAPLLSPLIHF